MYLHSSDYLSSLIVFFLFSFFVSINLALIGGNEVIRLQLEGNATFTSPTARNNMLEASYSVVQVDSHDTSVKLFCLILM